jgi:MFS family permease
VSQQPAELSGIKLTVRALRHRNYQLYYFGMLVSFVGTWMQTVAQSWLVYRLTNSELLLGLVGFAGQIPIFLFTPIGGVLADRYSRQRIILVTQTLAMLQAFALAILTLTHQINVELVIILALTLGCINAFDLPTRQSLLSELVEREDLMNAIALNSSMVNGSRIVGPAIAGVLVAWLGEGWCFLINAISYIAAIMAFFAMRIPRRQPDATKPSALFAFKEGFNFVRKTAPIRALLLLVALVSVCGLSYLVLMPIFADQILNGGAKALGLMLSAAGIGSLGAALTLAARRQPQGLGRIVAISVAAFGLLLMLFSFSRNLIFSCALLVPMGYTVMLQLSGSNTLLQTMVDDRLRGRVMSFFSLSLMGMSPFGNLLAGVVANRIGAPWTLAIGGSICVVGATVFGLRLPTLKRAAATLMPSQEITPNQ